MYFLGMLTQPYSNLCLTVSCFSTGRAGGKVQFGPNLNEFVRRFDAERTDGQGTY